MSSNGFMITHYVPTQLGDDPARRLKDCLLLVTVHGLMVAHFYCSSCWFNVGASVVVSAQLLALNWQLP